MRRNLATIIAAAAVLTVCALFLAFYAIQVRDAREEGEKFDQQVDEIHAREVLALRLELLKCQTQEVQP